MTDGEPGNTMRGRVGNQRDRMRLYVQLNVNRIVLAGAIALAFFLTVLALSVLDATPIRAAMRSSDPVETLFQAFVTAIITGVTLVVTISQLVLSQETGPLGDQRDRMKGAMDFRREVEDFFDATSPPEPASFLQALVDMSGENAEELRDTIEDERDGMPDELGEFLDALVENADVVSDDLDEAQFGRYQVVKAALDYNYSWKIYQARRLRRQLEGELSKAEGEAFDDLVRVLEFFGPAREHIKTLYFQWELVELSRQLIYVSLPALVAAVGVLAMLDAASFPGTLLGVDNINWVVVGASTLACLPFFLLGTYILRLTTIARRTLAIGPFILRQSGRSEDIDWES